MIFTLLCSFFNSTNNARMSEGTFCRIEVLMGKEMYIYDYHIMIRDKALLGLSFCDQIFVCVCVCVCAYTKCQFSHDAYDSLW